ncbi:MAG: tRNA (5-methylaminomethyl-2-thiouridine)(34)-methyltransferase MnmD [Flavobacteriales bacterium]|nr:MAG: tRNA (5-methylaminomethyl-2-thiouridine)(34)-methyltransferase MnmD [Flavobacteriales bacterium]
MEAKETLEIRVTRDGSRTLFNPATNEPYHSLHGAATESRHVFIEAGLKAVEGKHARVLEVGLGTGLNLLLTLEEAQRSGRSVDYVAVEPHRLSAEVLNAIDHCGALGLEQLRAAYDECMAATSAWITDRVPLTCIIAHDLGAVADGPFDVVYFDAFAPGVEPALWSEEVFARLFMLMRPGGVLVTYCVKGDVKRALKRCGFGLQRLKGPRGKREMLRAQRPL